MFVNCGIAVRTETGVQFEIWDGAEKYQFFITTENLSRLLQDEQNVPVGRKFGVFENPEYGRAALTHPNCNGQRKGVVFRVDCLKGRTFSIARRALMQVARRKWAEACVSEMLPDPIPAPGARRGRPARSGGDVSERRLKRSCPTVTPMGDPACARYRGC